MRRPLRKNNSPVYERFDTVGVFDAVYGCDVRMIQGRKDLRFPLETSQALSILRELLGENFDGDFALQLRVDSAVNLSHPAASQLADDFVVGKSFSDHRQTVALRTYFSSAGK